MADTSGDFISLATRPLADDETCRTAARDELAARIAHSDAAESTITEATRRLSAREAPTTKRFRHAALAAWILLLSALVLLLPGHWREARLLDVVHRQGHDGLGEERVLQALGPVADDVPLRSDAWRDLEHWEAQAGALLAEDPDDPARYLHRLRGYARFRSSDPLPGDYHERWRALAPDNALWGINAADTLSDQALGRAAPPAVTDEAAFQRAFLYLHEAAKCSRIESPTPAILARQIRSFSPDGSLRDLYLERALLSMAYADEGPRFFNLSGALPLQARRFEAAGDTEGMDALMNDLRAVLILCAEDGQSDALTLGYAVGYDGATLSRICRDLGLEEHATWWDALIQFTKDLRNPARFASGPSPHAGAFEAWTGWHDAASAPTVDDLKPGRLAEYAVADRFIALVGVGTAFLLLSACGLEIVRRDRRVRGLAKGLFPLFRRGDRLAVIGLGLALPLAWWIGIVLLSPLGCRDFGLSHFRNSDSVPLMQPWLSQGLGGLVFAVVAMVQAVRWRWAKRGAFLSLRPPRLGLGWLAMILAALFVALPGAARYLPSKPESFLLFSSAAGGIALLWLLWRGALALVTPADNALGPQLVARSLAPLAIGFGVIMLAAMPLLRARERAWVAEHPLSRPEARQRGGVRLDFASQEAIRNQLLEILR